METDGMTVANSPPPTPIRNPLTSTVFTWLVLDLLAAKYAADHHQFDIFTVVPIVQAVVLLVLYLRTSKYAGDFLFWSTAPMFPIYFGSIALGLYGTPVRPLFYVAAFLFWCVGLVFIWRLKQNYTIFLVTRKLGTGPTRA